MSVGVLVWPPVTDVLLEYYGVRGTLLILSALSLNGLVFSALFRPNNEIKQIQTNINNSTPADEMSHNKETRTTFSRWMVLYLPFTVYLVGFCVMVTGHLFMLFYYPLKSYEHGITLAKTASLMSMLGITSKYNFR